MSASMSGPNRWLKKAAPSHLILDTTTANAHSSGMVINNPGWWLGIANQSCTANSARTCRPIIFAAARRVCRTQLSGNNPGNGSNGVPKSFRLSLEPDKPGNLFVGAGVPCDEQSGGGGAFM